MQTKKQSFIEASINTFIGFVISYASTFIIFPLMGFNSSASKNIIITLFFTVVSIFRGYVVRRLFNRNENPVQTIKQIDTSQKCSKKNCLQPPYEFGYCFHHYMEGEMRTGG